jgi:hypothetical protein
MGNNLANFIGGYIDRGRKSKALDGVLSAYAGDDPEQQKQLKAALPGMSLEEKQGLVQGHAIRTAQKDLKLRELAANTNRDYMSAQIEGIRGNQNRMKLADEAQAGFGKDLNLFAAMDGENPPLALAPSMRRTLQQPGGALTLAAARNPLAPSAQNVLGDAMPALARQRGDMGLANLSWEEDPVTGYRVGRLGNQLLPSGINPEKAARATTVTDEAGNPVGHVDSRGRPMREGSKVSDALRVFGERRKLGAQLSEVLRTSMLASTPEQKTKIEEQVAKIGALEAELEKLLPGAAGAGASAAAGESTVDLELEQAKAAIAAGSPRAQVQALYKQRTGRDLP